MFRQKSHIGYLRPLDGRDREAKRILTRVWWLVKPIMRRRGWKIRVLGEIRPSHITRYCDVRSRSISFNKGIFPGIRWGSRRHTYLRLRSQSQEGEFRPFDEIMNAMLRELASIEYDRRHPRYEELFLELQGEYQARIQRQGSRQQTRDTSRRQLGLLERTVLNVEHGEDPGGPSQDNEPISYEEANRRMELLEQNARELFDGAIINIAVQAHTRDGIESPAEDDMSDAQSEMATVREPRVVQFTSWITPRVFSRER